MPPSEACLSLKQTYHALLSLEAVFESALKEAVKTKDYTHLETLKREIETKQSCLEQTLTKASLRFAETLFGNNYLGPKAIEQTFGFLPEHIPNIPFSRQELRAAQERGELLIYHTDTTKEGIPMTGAYIHTHYGTQRDGGKLLFDPLWYQNEAFFTTDTPRSGWRLVTPEVLPHSTDKNYHEQTQLLADHLETLAQSHPLAPTLTAALTEWNKEKDTLAAIIATDWHTAAQKLSMLKLNQLTRESFIERLYCQKMLNHTQGKYALSDTWTNSLASDGRLVLVCGFDTNGIDVYNDQPGHRDYYLGVSFSRSA